MGCLVGDDLVGPAPRSARAGAGNTDFYVVPEYRNRGLGGALLAELKARALNTGMDVLIVWPSDRSVHLYRRAGFEPSAELLEAR